MTENEDTPITWRHLKWEKDGKMMIQHQLLGSGRAKKKKPTVQTVFDGYLRFVRVLPQTSWFIMTGHDSPGCLAESLIPLG